MKIGKIALGLAAAMSMLTTVVARAQAPDNDPQLVAADLRPSTMLDGLWNYSIDPYQSGLFSFHGGVPGRSETRWNEVDVMQVMRGDTLSLFEFDMAAAPTASLPSSWLTHSAEMRHYQGLVWYQRHFSAAPTLGKRTFLRFGAANYFTRVYVNGQPIGEHEGGFTPFAFEVTDVLRDGNNQITVGVDSTATRTSVPPMVTDWENYGGITREVTLIEVPQTFVDDAWVRLTPDGDIAAEVELNGPRAANTTLVLTIAGLNLRMTGTTDASGTWRATMAAPAALVRWSPETPQLYDVTIRAGEDTWHDRVGFRTIEVRGSEILLNGRPVFLRGISLHEEELGASPTRAMTRASSRALLTIAKDDLNANFVRLAHYPHSEVTTRMADELGLMVWSEVPVYWRIAFDNQETLSTARELLADNIRRDRNRASIVLWSVANETPVTDVRNAFLGTLVDDVRALDQSRLVTAALLVERTERDGHPVMTLADPLAARLDVLSVNTYNGWYGSDRLADVPAIEWDLPDDRPLVFSEFGAGAQYGFRDSRSSPQKFSEEFQADYYRATLAMTANIPTLRGMSPWVLKDFRSPRRQNLLQQGWNRKGLISETGEYKLAFDVLANYYSQLQQEAPR